MKKDRPNGARGIAATALLAAIMTLIPDGEASAQRYSAADCDASGRDVSWRHSRGRAAGGAVTGGTARGVQRGSIDNRAYDECMRGIIRRD
jgi:hypothetical protein